MVSHGVRSRFAGSGARRIGAYLRLLSGRGRTRPEGLCSLRDELAPRLRDVVADAIGVDAHQLDAAVSLQNDLAVDSLDLLELAGRVEDAFDVRVPERELGSVSTFGDLLAVVTALVACRLRARDATPSALELRVGDGAIPRFLRVVGPGAYDRELLHDDLRTMRADGVTVVGERSSAPLERALVRASLAGADVRGVAGDAPGVDAPLEVGEDVRAWPASRLTALAVVLVEDLGAERDASLERLERRRGARALAARRAATHARVAAFRAVVETYIDVLADVRSVLYPATAALGRLDVVRDAIDERTIAPADARDAYDAGGDALLAFVQALAPDTAWATRLPPRGIARDRVDDARARELRA
jgi:acyl carrier protein